jgi:hypothetical protein
LVLKKKVMKVVSSNGILQNKIQKAEEDLILEYHRFIPKDMACGYGVPILTF